MKLHTIDREAKDCRAAWAAKPRAKAGAHIHHETPFEALTEWAEARIDYILAGKPKAELALRLRLMRPVRDTAWAEYEKATAPALAEYQKAEDTAWAEYNKVIATALPASAEYKKDAAAAWAEYKKAEVPAWAEYKKARAAALAEYQKATAPAHRRLCPTPDCPWGAESIFGGVA